MRASRLVSIMILLQVRGRMTADELASELEVSVRTIYRDLESLGGAGVPVYGDRGPGGGFQLIAEFRTPLTGLVADEAEAVLMAGLPGPASSLGIGPAARRAADKVLAALPPAQRAGADRVASRFHIDPAPWYHADTPLPALPDLARAVLEDRSIEMTYASWTASRPWRVDPLGLVLKGGSWYLVAQCTDGIRMFNVASMSHQVITTCRFERPDHFTLAAWWTAQTQRFESELLSDVATLRVDEEGLRRLGELGTRGTHAVAGREPPETDGWCVVRLAIEAVGTDDSVGTRQAALTVLGLGPHVEVITPTALRECVHRLAGVIADRHR